MSGWRLDTRCSAERVNRHLYQRAVQGYPSKASREKGEAILKVAVEELVQLIKGLREDGLPLNKVA
jgi:creatinine amidohydrolase